MFDIDKLLKNYYVESLRVFYALAVILIISWGFIEEVAWWEYIITFYLGLLFARIGSEVGFHRYFSHKSYKTTPLKEKLLLWLGTVNGVGSCISWATMHRIHHTTADTEKDPHSPYYYSVIKSFFGIPRNDIKYDHRITKDLYKDKLQIFTHKHYFKINIGFIMFLAIMSYILQTMYPIIIFFAMANFSLFMLYGITNTVEHFIGYKTFPTTCNSKNQHLLRILWMGAGLHNNHHYKPASYTFNIRNNWWECDFDGWLIKRFFALSSK